MKRMISQYMVLSCMIYLLAASLLVMLSTEELLYQANNASIQILHIIQISIGLCDILFWIYYYFMYCKVIFSGDRRNISMISRSEPDPDHIVFMASHTPQQPPTKFEVDFNLGLLVMPKLVTRRPNQILTDVVCCSSIKITISPVQTKPKFFPTVSNGC